MARIQNESAVYNKHARFDSAKPMTEDEMRASCPSIFATQAHESRSERFRPVPTIEVLRGLQKEGFSVVGCRQSKSRDASKHDFTKHLVRLRKIGDPQQYRVGDTTYEVLLRNANDGTASYELLGGLFRIACLNSLVTHTKTLDSVKVYHKGNDIVHKVIDGSYRVLQNSEAILAAPDAWSQIKLTRDMAMTFAHAAHTIRFADIDGETTTPIKPEQLLIPRRPDDVEPNLWTIANVIQENCLKGGLSAVGRSETTGKMRQFTTKAVTAVDGDVKLNKALWVLNERMAELLGAKPLNELAKAA